MLPKVVPLSRFGMGVTEAGEWINSVSGLAAGGAPQTDQRGISDPPWGAVLMNRLLHDVREITGEPRLEPNCSFVWIGDAGVNRLDRHTDRDGLDVTVHIPCAPTDGWPLHLEDSDSPGGEFVWSGMPGTVLISDGKVRPHWRPRMRTGAAGVLLLHFSRPGGVVEKRGLFTPRECEHICAIAEAKDFALGRVEQRKGDGHDSAVRQKSRLTNVTSVTNAWIMERLHSLAKRVHPEIKRLPTAQFASYDTGHHFVWHADKSSEDTHEDIRPRRVSTSVMLTPADSGGVLEIKGYGQCLGDPGDGWAFPSFQTLHRVTPVEAGKRRSLVGWHHRKDT